MTKSTGRQREREEQSDKRVAGCFNEIIRLVADGVPMVKACNYVQGKPTINAVRWWMRKYPDQKQRFDEAKRAAGGSKGHSKFSPSAWSAALQSIATADEALSRLNRQGEPDYGACLKRAARDPAFAERFNEALHKRNSRPDRRPARFSAAAYDEALAVLRENPHKRLTDLNAELVAKRLPKLGAIYSAKVQKSEIAAKFSDISADRGVRRYSDEQHAEAMALLKSEPTKARRLLRAAAGRLPSFGALISRAKFDADFAAIYEEARVQRTAAYREASAAARLARKKIRKTRKLKPVYLTNVLRSGLLLDELYLEASKLFHSGLPAHLRDDMISEVVLTALQDGMTPQDIKARGKAVGWKFANQQTNKRTETLDRPVYEDGSMSFGDTFTADEWCFEDAI